MTHEREEAGDGKSLVAIPGDVKVNGVKVVFVGEKRNQRVDGDHEDDANDARRNQLAFPRH